MVRLALATALVTVSVPLMAALADVAGDPPLQRQAELVYQVEQDCGSCHGLTMKGGLGPALLPDNLAEMPDEALAEIILNGVPGTPMPPWSFEISNGEAAWIVKRLKEGL
jgi:cytochrome c55X